MKQQILIPQDISSIGKNFLEEHGYKLKITGRTSFSDLRADVRDCDAVLARTCKYPSDLFQNAPRLKCIARHGSGYDNIDVAAAAKYGVYVCTTPTAPVNSVAEHTILLLLACAQNLSCHDRNRRMAKTRYTMHRNCTFGTISRVLPSGFSCILPENTSRNNGGLYSNENSPQTNGDLYNPLFSTEVRGKTLGIIGFGHIGQSVARKAYYGLDMKVLAFGRSTPSDPGYQDYCRFTSDLDEALAQSDYISIHLPSTPESRMLLSKERLAQIKPGSTLINTSRGDLLDENLLYDLLKNGRLKGAALDVFQTEPCFSTPLFQLDNVIATPHSAALTQEAMDQMGLLAAQEIHRVLTGQKPLWPVNL